MMRLDIVVPPEYLGRRLQLRAAEEQPGSDCPNYSTVFPEGFARNANTHRTNSAGFSSAGKCPHCGITSSFDPGMSLCRFRPTASGIISSCSPHTINVGTLSL